MDVCTYIRVYIHTLYVNRLNLHICPLIQLTFFNILETELWRIIRPFERLETFASLYVSLQILHLSQPFVNYFAFKEIMMLKQKSLLNQFL